MNDLKSKLLDEIQKGELSMTPRAYFVLKLIALSIVGVGILLVTIFIFNFISFSLRASGETALLSFGTRGIGTFLFYFPWLLLVVDITLILLLQWLLRNFKFGYRIPVLYLVLGLIFGAAVFGFAVDTATPFNDRLHDSREHLPQPLQGFYEGARGHQPKGSGICRCTIITIDGNVLVVEDARDATSTITVILPEDDYHATTSGLNIGDVIFIAGDEIEGVIRAFGVHKEELRHQTFFDFF